ncbi:MAG: protein kinase [Planctomycetia bacterium]
MTGGEDQQTKRVPDAGLASRPTAPLTDQTVAINRATRPVTFPYAIGDPILPGYRLVKLLGRGGFGEVWQADAPGGMSVAIKVLVNVGRREGTREYRALQTVKDIRHAHMVPVFGVWLKASDGTCLGEADVAEAGRRILGNHGAAGAESPQQAPLELIVAMGLGDGTLHDRLQASVRAGATGLPPEQLLDWMRQAALALDHFNAGARTATGGAAAVQHCDIKPQNILLVGDVVQVCDFGLARTQGEVRATSNNMASLAYAPPEMVTAPYDPAPTTDQYSLAISYLELRTGRLPNRDTTVVGVLNEKLSGHLDLDAVCAAERQVLKRALDLDPAKRWPSCSAFIRALALAVGPLEAANAAPAAQPAPTASGAAQPLWLWALPVAAGALLLAMAAPGWLRGRPASVGAVGKPEPTPDVTPPLPPGNAAAAARKRAEELEANGNRVAAAEGYAAVPGIPAGELAAILWDLHSESIDAGRAADCIPILVRLEAMYGTANAPQVPGFGRWDVVNALAWYLATVPEGSDPTRARTLAEEAVALAGEDPEKRSASLDTLAAALARDGDFAAAVARLEEAIGLAAKSQPLVDLEKHLEAYRSGVPWTTP